MAPQVLGVTSGSPLCPWCCGHSSWRGARQESMRVNCALYYPFIKMIIWLQTVQKPKFRNSISTLTYVQTLLGTLWIKTEFVNWSSILFSQPNVNPMWKRCQGIHNPSFYLVFVSQVVTQLSWLHKNTHTYHHFKNVIPFAIVNGKLSIKLASIFGLGGA